MDLPPPWQEVRPPVNVRIKNEKDFPSMVKPLPKDTPVQLPNWACLCHTLFGAEPDDRARDEADSCIGDEERPKPGKGMVWRWPARNRWGVRR